MERVFLLISGLNDEKLFSRELKLKNERHLDLWYSVYFRTENNRFFAIHYTRAYLEVRTIAPEIVIYFNEID